MPLQLPITAFVTYLLVELHEGRFELLVDVSAEVVLVDALAEALRLLGLAALRQSLRAAGQLVEGYEHVLAVLQLLQLAVGDLLVAHEGGVVGRHEAWKLREV